MSCLLKLNNQFMTLIVLLVSIMERYINLNQNMKKEKTYQKDILSKKLKEKLLNDFRIGGLTEPYKDIFCLKLWGEDAWQKQYFVVIRKDNRGLVNLSSLTKKEEKLVTRLLKLRLLKFPQELIHKKVLFLVGNSFHWYRL